MPSNVCRQLFHDVRFIIYDKKRRGKQIRQLHYLWARVLYRIIFKWPTNLESSRQASICLKFSYHTYHYIGKLVYCSNKVPTLFSNVCKSLLLWNSSEQLSNYHKLKSRCEPSGNQPSSQFLCG